ncbi:MAG: hypothetical protein O2906_01020 [Bacteroidetes bacterium]|nr:hypothetical protein [Bacteroidota bacterium]MDA0859540.1 hypothetical protein [Bacteroidota bacterium]MDA1317874.1 hypothetical protein [Bacteroidota bacterium]
MNTVTKPTPRYWLISIIALLWNFMGIIAYLGQAYMSDEALKMLPEENQLYFSNVPAWVTASFAVAVFGGFIGSIGLIIRKKWAYFLFLTSFLALVAQHIYNFFIQNYIEMTGSEMILPIVTFIVAVLLIYFSKQKSQQGVLR